MAKKPEGKFSKKLTEATRNEVHWTRIESWALPGVPDLHGCSRGKCFWIETKVVALPSVNFLTVRQMELRPHQIQWQMQYARSGGLVYNLVHRPSSSLLQLYAAANLDEGPWSPILEDDDNARGMRTVVEYIMRR